MTCIDSTTARNLILVAAVGLLINGPAIADEPKSPPTPTVKLTVIHSNYDLPTYVLVTLHQGGKVLRSRELNCRSARNDEVIWENVPVGKCEVHFEAPNSGKFVKHLVLTEADAATTVRVEFDPNKKAASIGGGPSLDDLAAELKELKKINAELKAAVDELQAELKALKKP
jgi:hypothetical protein